MPWNYRVCKTKNDGPLPDDDPFLYHIREVYYDKDGQIQGYAAASVDNWTSLEDLRGTVESMLRAFDKPVLE
jgi:hypothetical protein